MRRLWAAAESLALGRGGISLVARASGVSRRAIRVGISELRQKPKAPQADQARSRRKGGGRKRTQTKDPTLLSDLEKLVDPFTRGDPETGLRWTCKSVRKLADELRRQGHTVSPTLVAELLDSQDYRLQANRKTKEGASHPDRNAQFEYINAKVQEYLRPAQPAISVDTKKKEQVGDYKNGGREWQPTGKPEKVPAHDFGKQKDALYGVCDLGQNVGWVNVGTDHDTAAFAVESIRQWWYSMGRPCYSNGSQLLITADSGGSNGARVRLWKLEIQRLANETGLEISVCPLPAGYQQVEPDRTPAVLIHYPKRARQTAGQPRGHSQSNCCHHDTARVASEESFGHRKIPEGSQGEQRGVCHHLHKGRHLPRRRELYDLAQKRDSYFLTDPKRRRPF